MCINKLTNRSLNMKLNLLVFGGSSALAVISLVVGHALIQTHMMTIMAGWAIFVMGLAFGLALAIVLVFYEILSRSFK